MTPDQFMESVTRVIVNEAYNYVLPAIPSTTLQAALVVQVYDPFHAALFITYYWAMYVHDGRLPFSKTNIMCWFRNPQLDPRLNGGITPARLSDVRHLSPGEFKFWLGQNRAAERAVYGRLRRPGEAQVGPMIITREIKRGTPGSFFFENSGGMSGFIDTIFPLVGPMLSDYITKDVLKGVLNINMGMKMAVHTRT
jgi:hypothetical protein